MIAKIAADFNPPPRNVQSKKGGKDQAFGRSAKFGQRDCLFYILIIGIKK